MVVAIALVCWFVLVGGNFHKATGSSVDSLQNDDAEISFLTAKTDLAAVTDEASSTTIYHLIAGRPLPEKVEIKRSEPEAKHAIDKTTTNIPATYPGATRIAILLALLLLSAMLIPMALAEPISTSMQPPSLTLPASLPSTTAFNATGTALSIDLQQKDKPQSWYWIPPNSSDRASVNSVLSLIPFLLMGVFFLFSSLTVGNLEKDIKIIDDMVVTKRDSTPSSELSPVWIIDFSTTTVWPPASTITSTNSEPTEKPISVAGNGGLCGPRSAEVEICTEKNPAVCPVVLGRKPWTPV